MSRISWIGVVAAAVAILMVTTTPALADQEEERLAREAELNPQPAGVAVMAPGYLEGAAGSAALLFVGVDDSAIPAYVVDPADNTTLPAFTGFQVWGAALIPGASPGDGVVYFNSGTTLYRWPATGTPELCCTLTFGGANQSMVSMAYDPAAGELLFTKNIATEAVYSLAATSAVCPASCEVTQEIVYSSTLDIGGLAYDPVGQILYGTNDSGTNVVQINPDGTTTIVAAYPAGQTDIDGLAYGNGRLYLVTDQPGSIYVYNVGTASYETPLTNPWTTSETFSGAAFGSGLVIPVELQSFTAE
jgi:hypothetical protein